MLYIVKCVILTSLIKLFCTYDNTVISSCMSFFGFPSVTEFIDQRIGVNFSLNLMHQITCCAAFVSPRIGNVNVEMSARVYMFAAIDFHELI